MHYKSIRYKSKFIDSLIDHYRKTNRTPVLPLDAFGDIVQRLFPSFEFEGKGRNKISFLVHENKKKLVLKIGSKDTIENDPQCQQSSRQNKKCNV